ANVLLEATGTARPRLRLSDFGIAMRLGEPRLEEIAAERAGGAQVDIAVHHLAASERASALADRLRTRVPGLADLHVSEVGAVIGAHTGPGLLGVVVSPR
ncbi:DegV family protein, partial [Streptomyces nigra]